MFIEKETANPGRGPAHIMSSGSFDVDAHDDDVAADDDSYHEDAHDEEEGADDDSMTFIDSYHDIQPQNFFMASLTSEEPSYTKWSYFREDQLLHDFHSKFHRIYFVNTEKSEYENRTQELFHYMHQQFMRRYQI